MLRDVGYFLYCTMQIYGNGRTKPGMAKYGLANMSKSRAEWCMEVHVSFNHGFVNFMDWKTTLCFVSVFWPAWKLLERNTKPQNTLKCRTLTGRSLENNVLTENEAISCFDDAVLSVEIGTHVEKVLSVVQSYQITSADGSQYIPFVVRDTNSSGPSESRD